MHWSNMTRSPSWLCYCVTPSSVTAATYLQPANVAAGNSSQKPTIAQRRHRTEMTSTVEPVLDVTLTRIGRIWLPRWPVLQWRLLMPANRVVFVDWSYDQLRPRRCRVCGWPWPLPSAWRWLAAGQRSMHVILTLSAADYILSVVSRVKASLEQPVPTRPDWNRAQSCRSKLFNDATQWNLNIGLGRVGLL